jgi:riboflavin biosynthesis pyrimidine reductase
MGLLRAFADVVLIGAGTLASSTGGPWTAEKAYPAATEAYGELRGSLGGAERPELAILTGRGSIDPTHPALEKGAVILTSASGAASLRGRVPSAATIVPLEDDPLIDPRRAVDALHQRGHRQILVEAGPHAFGSLLRAGLVDELFLTLSPLVAGISAHGDRLDLVEGAARFLGEPLRGRLLSLRRQGAHLFLRYALG